MSKIGFIGGSGIYNIEGIELVREHLVETPFGSPSDKVLELSLDGNHFYFLPRHGRGHSLLPSEVNYRANIYALKSLGVQNIVSVSAVGSLKEEIAPRMIFLPDQFIDWTKGRRERTFFGNGMVGHVSTSDPINKELKEKISIACRECEVEYKEGGSYICIEGPQFSSRAESEIYRSFGASVIGMTNVPEAFLAIEAGMAYATIALVTDYDCWKEEACSVEEIMKVLGFNYTSAQKLIRYLVPVLTKDPIQVKNDLSIMTITKKELLNEKHEKILSVLSS